MEYVTYDEVMHIYKRVISETGGELGVLYEGGLRYLLETLPQIKGDLFAKASHLTVRFVLTHPLINGNKRVALIATILFLAKNGHSLRASPKQRVDLLLSISKGELKEGEVAEWLKSHSVKDVR